MSRSRKIFLWIIFAFFSLLLLNGRASAQTCSWQGTSPFCSGTCGANESEETRSRTDPRIILNSTGARIDFGADCLTGTKAMCCQTPQSTCRWQGTAPFCAGECKGSEVNSSPPPGSSSGASCWTGTKAYCCTFRPVTSTGSQRLVTDMNGIIYTITQNNDLM